jgi:hypothetical protein
MQFLSGLYQVHPACSLLIPGLLLGLLFDPEEGGDTSLIRDNFTFCIVRAAEMNPKTTERMKVKHVD